MAGWFLGAAFCIVGGFGFRHHLNLLGGAFPYPCHFLYFFFIHTNGFATHLLGGFVYSYFFVSRPLDNGTFHLNGSLHTGCGCRPSEGLLGLA